MLKESAVIKLITNLHFCYFPLTYKKSSYTNENIEPSDWLLIQKHHDGWSCLESQGDNTAAMKTREGVTESGTERQKEQRHKERVRGKRAIICLPGLITIRLKPKSEWKTEGRTKRDGVLVEVNISQRGYNDRCELGLGLWDCGR